MKIIQPSRSPKVKGESSSVSEAKGAESNAGERKAEVRSSHSSSKVSARKWKSSSPKKFGRSVRKDTNGFSGDSQFGGDSVASEDAFVFDASGLEAMPKDEVVELLPEGKKRRRTELLAEKVGDPLTLIDDLAKKEFNDLFARGIRLLAMREHSVKEMVNKLSDKSQSADGFDCAETSDTILAVIDELLEKKYLSDERFTESYIRSRGNRGFGPIKIKAELKNKGVSNTLIQDYLDHGAAVWFDHAKSQYKKKYGDGPIGDYSIWTKRARFMQGRGFTMEQIQVTVPQFSSD